MQVKPRLQVRGVPIQVAVCRRKPRRRGCLRCQICLGMAEVLASRCEATSSLLCLTTPKHRVFSYRPESGALLSAPVRRSSAQPEP